VATAGRRPPYHAQRNGCRGLPPVADRLIRAVFGPLPFATVCHRLRPLGSINACAAPFNLVQGVRESVALGPCANCGSRGSDRRSQMSVQIPPPLLQRPRKRGLCVVRPAWVAAWGCESSVVEMTLTTSRRQLRHREVGWEGSPRRIRDPRDTNRVEGGAAWASRQRTAKPVVIKGPQRRRGGCAGKVAVLIRGGLHGCSDWDGGGREAAARRGEVSSGRSTGWDRVEAGKGQTQSRGVGRSCSWESR
jgi:hypothetical protein